MDGSSVDLLERVADGDHGAFVELYDAFAARTYGLLVKLLGDRTEAEDVLQEVWCEVWRRARSFDASLGGADTWLLMLARARGIDRLRRRGRHRPEARDIETIEATPERDGWDEPLAHAMEALPADQRNLLHLAFYHGFTREQIADMQGVPIGTVKTRIRATVAKLRELLAEPEVVVT